MVKQRYAETAFDGEGARQYGGRWNSPGTSVAYAAATASLAVLEVLVHLDSSVPLSSYSLVSLEFNDASVRSLAPGERPDDWWASPPSAATQAIGDRWVTEGDAMILRVPSIIIPSEYNYLINIGHHDARQLRIGVPVPFVFDPRLLHRSDG